jgi:hypothetical protein
MNKQLPLDMEHLSLSIEAPLGDNRGEAAILGTLTERRDFIRRPCLLGDPRDMKKTALEMSGSLHMGPVGEGGLVLPGTLRDR